MMKYLDKKWKIILYACSGLGLNMLNIILGSHLCNALLVDGFDKNLDQWTYESKTLVVVGAWMVLSVIVKIFDGLVDIPLANFTDNLRTRWGRRRPAILIGYIPLLVSYLLFLVPLSHGQFSILNTVWFAILLAIFYSGYTLTMVTYYATFAEIVKTENERRMLSTVKSICDVVYFSLNFALVPLFVGFGLNIRIIALIFLPLALTMLIPLFMIKEESTKDGIVLAEGTKVQTERVGFIKSFAYAFKNTSFIYWLCIVFIMNIGLQLFLNGISIYFSNIGMPGSNMTLIMASSFVPVPFTLLLYNRIMRKKGLAFAFRYVLTVFAVGMSLMMLCLVVPEAAKLPLAIGCAIIVSFAIGAFFSITYQVPSQMAADQNKKGEVCASTMYFAVQGLFEAVSAAFAAQVVLVFIRTFGGADAPLVKFFPVIVAAFCMIAFGMSFFLKKNVSLIGKENKED